MGKKEVLKQKQYFEINVTKEQQSEEYYLNASTFQNKAMEEAQNYVTNETAQEQKIKEAEKIAGLNQKTVPAEEVPEEVMKQMEAEYASIHKGKAMSGKAKSKVKKEYLRKERQSASVKKIYEAQSTASRNVADFMISQALMVTGKEKLDGNNRKNSHAVALATMMNGQTMVNATYAMRSLSVNWDRASDEECEKKALETERIFKVIMDYDLSKLKYNNSDEFLKNLGEKLTITNLAMECDNLLTDYRAMKEAGKIKDPLADKFINEADARIQVLTTIATRITQKARIMKSPLYSRISEDSIKDLSTDEVVQRMMQYSTKAMDPNATDEEKQQAAEYRDYYEAIMTLRNMDGVKDAEDRFGRGTDPNKMLDMVRKKVNKAHPPVEDQKEAGVMRTDEGYREASISSQYAYWVDSHIASLKSNQSGLAFQNTKKDAVDYANFVNASHMQFVKENPALRKREIKRYYAKMHRGKEIPGELLNKIEQRFSQRFEEAEKLSRSTSTIDAFNRAQANRVNAFLDAHKDQDGNSTITIDRGANAYLCILDDKTMAEREQAYEAFRDLVELHNENGKELLNLRNLPEEEQEKERKRIADGAKPLLDFVNGFDVKKLEFQKPSELISRYNEIGPFLNIVEELQKFPQALINLGIAEEKSWIEFQARVVMAQDLSMIVKNMMALQSSAIYSLVDDKGILDILAAGKVDLNDPEEIENSGFDIELIKDGKAYDDKSGNEDALPELNQIRLYLDSLNSQLQVSYFKPGSSMAAAMEKYKSDAKKEWDQK